MALTSSNIISFFKSLGNLSGDGKSVISLKNSITAFGLILSNPLYCSPVEPMMYSLSKYILARISFFNKNVLPHSLGPYIIHLTLSGNVASVIISSSFSHDCRSSFMFIEIGETASRILLVGDSLLLGLALLMGFHPCFAIGLRPSGNWFHHCFTMFFIQ